MFPRLVTFTATERSTAHTKCRNGVEDLERSIELCGRAVADNENEAGKLAEKIESQHWDALNGRSEPLSQSAARRRSKRSVLSLAPIVL